MPSYLYDCKSCEVRVTVVRSVHDPERIPLCVGCGKHLVRVFDAPNVSFSGSGFYSTDK